tara:strand:- start:814 stop:1062 length:249 start_codon:yes stop_codon:yes gene_type:complete
MPSTFKKIDYSNYESNSENKIVNFLNDLRILLNKHDIKLYGDGCEVYVKNLGYIGYLEDNIQTIEIIDGNESLYSSNEFIDE